MDSLMQDWRYREPRKLKAASCMCIESLGCTEHRYKVNAS